MQARHPDTASRKPIATDAVTEHRYRHRCELQIRFNDVDAFGHVNNSVYFQFYDTGKSAYFYEVNGSLAADGLGVVIANVNCTFITPIEFGEPIAVETQVSSVGEKSFTMKQRIINTSTGEVKSYATSIMVAFDIRKKASVEITPLWLDNLSKFEHRDFAQSRATATQL